MSIMGDDFEVVGEEMGEDVMGDDYEVVGAAPRPRLLRAVARQRVMRVPAKPSWRQGQLAPGVPGPSQGLEPLPLTPNLNGGVFDPANPAIDFTARPQAPFRAERLLASVRRSAGAGGILILCQALFIGRELQQVESGPFDVEFFAPTAFGVRLNLAPAEPGILIRLILNANPIVPVGETVAVSMMFLGRTIRA